MANYENMLINCIIQNPDIIDSPKYKIDSSLFLNDNYSKAFKEIKDYWEEYKKVPGFKELEDYQIDKIEDPLDIDIIMKKIIRRKNLSNIYGIIEKIKNLDENIDIKTYLLNKIEYECMSPHQDEKEVYFEYNKSDRLQDYEDHVLNIKENGIKSLIPSFDQESQGFLPSELHLILGDTKVGKTWFSLYLINNLLKQGVNVLLFSLEMTRDRIARRLDAVLSNISYDKIRKGSLNEEDIEKFEKNISVCQTEGGKLIIVNEDCNVRDIYKHTKYCIEKYNTQIVFIDQLSHIDISNKFDEWRQITQVMLSINKKIQQELNMPVVLISQMQSEVEKVKKDDKIKKVRHEPHEDQVSFTKRINRYLDFSWALYQSDEMRENKLMHLYCLLSREGPGKKIIPISWDMDNSNIREISKEEETVIITSTNSDEWIIDD